jgi:hypothetical protein
VKPSTELTVVVTDADGNTKTLDSHAPDPTDRPQGIQFGTQLAAGFGAGGFTLTQPIDRDRTDLHMLDDVRIVGNNGDTAYEGFVTELPRSMDDTHTLSVTTAGWIAHASDEPFTGIYIDRDLSQWGEPSIARRGVWLGLSYNIDGATNAVAPDETGTQGLSSTRQGVLNNAVGEFLYDAGPGNGILRLYIGTQTLVNLTSGDAALAISAAGWNTDNGGGIVSSGEQKTNTTIDFTLSAARRYMRLTWQYNSTAGGTAGKDYGVRWRNVAVIGDHGLPLLGTAPYGVSASDVIKHIAGLYCPLLDTSGVQTATYPISHLVFREQTRPYDAWLRVNTYHLWNLAVWENRVLHYQPLDVSDWDWEVRHDEVGQQIGLQGDSIENLRNGIIVQYTNATTGHVEQLHPDDYAELRDDSVENPANQHGRTLYGDPFVIPFPTTAADALELGRIKLAEDGQPKAPGSFTVTGHIRDRAGNWQPAWKVRAGDRVRLTSSASLSDRPRLIHETSYSHDGRQVTISVDSTLKYIEGYFDRVLTAMAANNLAT